LQSSGKNNVEALWKPYTDKLNAYKGITNIKINITEVPSYKGYFDARFGPAPLLPATDEDVDAPEPTDMNNLDSRLLGAEHFKHANLTQILKAAAPLAPLALQGHLIGGGKVFKPDDDVSVLPTWRKAIVHVIGNKVRGKSSVDSLRKLAPEMGAYVNEVSRVCFQSRTRR
jgi:hypothetical protein